MAVPKAPLLLGLWLMAGLALTGCSAGGAAAHNGDSVSLNDIGEAGVGPDDGYIESKDLSPFANDVPAIANLDPELREAMQSAASAAMGDGVDFVVTSGWRSAFYQQSLFDDAVRDYGSAELASQFVMSPDSSNHVTGNAVDIGHTDADSWLSQHGSDYGLCQIYVNEMWHFELATSPGGQCPAQLKDASAG
jgi:hypothetical protein